MKKETTVITSPKWPYQFELPKDLQTANPTEERKVARDVVRLMVSNIHSNAFQHTIFRNLGRFLHPGDLLVVNTSGTLKAGLDAKLPDGQPVVIHLSTRIDAENWVLELREVKTNAAKRFGEAKPGMVLELQHGGIVQLREPYYSEHTPGHLQLWNAELQLSKSIEEYLQAHGKPIRYSGTDRVYPQSYYQTVFANEMGSTEMPSAGRPFTASLVTSLISDGIQVAPLLLHTGVASLEVDERPYAEYYRVPEHTAASINTVRKNGGRVIAVGTTVVRALESAARPDGMVSPSEGWTNLFITPERGVYAVDGLLTGFHEPRASHLLMLEALAGTDHLRVAYQEALAKKYQWHEFGDSHLILP